MKVKIETEIIGNFMIERDMKIKLHPFDIDIRFDLVMNKYYISLSKKVLDYALYLPKVEIDDQKINEFNFPSQSFLEEQIKILQHVESFGALDKGIEKIDWQNYSIEWIPETKEEENELSIRKYNRDLSYGSESKILSKDWLTNTILCMRQLDHLALPFSFFREGVNFYHNFQYQNAFLNFFIMLEGFFGNGQHKQNGLEREFFSSDILEFAINETLIKIRTQQIKHYEWLIQKTNSDKKPLDKIGLIKFLIKMRGNLSHFSIKSSIMQRNPHIDKDYQSLAFIAMSICYYVTIKLRLEPFRKI